MDSLFQILKDDPAVKALTENRRGLSGLSSIEESLIFITSFRRKPRNLVIVKSNSYTAQQLFNRLYPLSKEDVLLFAVEESLRVEAVAASPSNYANQMETLASFCLENKPKIIVTHPMALMRYLPAKQVFENHILNVRIGLTYSMDKMRQTLLESGYRQETRVDQPLTFSVRGGVVDVFSIQYDKPIRIEFFDDEIDSIRFFDIATQRTIEKLSECKIVPASTLIYSQDIEIVKQRINEQLQINRTRSNNYNELKDNIEHDISYLENHILEHHLYRYSCFFDNMVSLLDYINNPQVILSTQQEIENSLTLINSENQEYIRELFENNKGLNYYSLFNDFDRLCDKINPYKIDMVTLNNNTIKSDIRMTYFPLLPLDKMVEEIIRLSKNYSVHLSINEGQKDLIEKEFNSINKKPLDYFSYCEQQYAEGFNYKDHVFLSEKELFGVKNVKGRFDSKFKEAIVLENYSDLKPGDYVVHNQYGIGQYEEIITRDINGKHRDFLKIRYKDNDLLLVPLEQFKLVRKFVAAESVGVKLSKLGTNTWNKTKEKISQEVSDIAERLVSLYAERENDIGFAFSKDDEMMRSFESNFPYQLTNDQIKAIAEVKYDMEQSRPMDRLLCGDVGFGKTEVAMVAAFKAVKDLKQVAYLCPTTILSRQHYLTFTERFKGFPVKIALLNRFVIESQQRQILKDLKEGKIDILIGTHRLISDDVKFADLGLLIVDEEQRFGVQAKEKIKELKRTIDVLSLSATPIPRTLQMSLVGVMSLSQLETAPSNRMSVQTYVVEKNDNLVKEVIQRELARNGQVFYLYNNVSEIYHVARKISMLVPDAKIAVGHGQMSRDELEDVMYRFVDGQYNVLICTTIIETGIDIPNANTILIDNAENFGLAQLYQIRGRVGRSDRVAYSYLMCRSNRSLSEIASKRLQAIKEFTELGSGFKVAMRDLTIRGAGDLLGERQAGFINTIGMSLYLDMLNTAIKKHKGISEEIIRDMPIKVNDIDGYIPQQFINQDYEKITVYQQLDQIGDKPSLDNYYEKMKDYYGKLPESIDNLFVKKDMEIMLNSERIEEYQQYEKENRLVLTKEFSSKVDGVKLFEEIDKISNQIKLKYAQGKITLSFAKTKGYNERIRKTMEVINQL